MNQKQREKIFRESSLVDASKAVLIENTIDAFPVLTYCWTCPACKQINFKLTPANKDKDAVQCDICKEKYANNLFDRLMLSEINKIMDNPDAIFSGGNRNTHTTRNGIEARPLIRFIWQCPNCGTVNPSIPEHKDNLIACVSPACQMRYPYSAVKHDYNKQFDRFVTELKIPIYNF